MGADEQGLRQAKDEAIAGVADLQRQAGRLPDIRAIEEMVSPILRKVDASADEVRGAAASPTARDRDIADGDWFGEPEHSPLIGGRKTSRVKPAEHGETLRVEARVLGEYRLGRTHAEPLNGAPTGERIMGQRERMLRDLVSVLLKEPDWRARFHAITFSNLLPHEREKAYRKILDDAVRIYGPPILAAVAAERRRQTLVGGGA